MMTTKNDLIRHLIFLLFFCVPSFIFSQFQLDIALEPGTSMVTFESNSIQEGMSTKFRLSGNAGLVGAYNLNEKWSGRIGLMLSQVEGMDHSTILVTDVNGNVIGEGFSNYKQHITYLMMPVNMRYKFSSFSIEVGGRASLHLKSNGYEYGEIPWNNDLIIIENQIEDINISKFDFGSLIRVYYHINPYFSTGISYYHGFHKIMDVNPSPPWQRSIRQITLGFNYSLFD